MYRSLRKPRTCPNCKSKRIASIEYGMPGMTPELEQRIAEGKLVLGGCCITMDDPQWQCVDCDTQIYRDFEIPELKNPR